MELNIADPGFKELGVNSDLSIHQLCDFRLIKYPLWPFISLYIMKVVIGLNKVINLKCLAECLALNTGYCNY